MLKYFYSCLNYPSSVFFCLFNYLESLNSHVFVHNLAFKFLAIFFVPHACADVFPRCWFWPSTVVIKLRRPKIPLYPANPRPNPFNFITTRPKPHYILLIRRSRQYCSFFMGIFQTFAIWDATRVACRGG
jgi:hypothetical protein